jgi:hypothetical protein
MVVVGFDKNPERRRKGCGVMPGLIYGVMSTERAVFERTPPAEVLLLFYR